MRAPIPRAPTLDPNVQAIFDALNNFMGTEYPVAYASGNIDGTGTTYTINCTDTQNNRWSYSEYTAGVRITLAPLSASLGPGETQQFTATATNPDGSAVASPVFAWAVNGPGTIDANGLYTAPASISLATSATIRCTLTGDVAYTAVQVNLHT